MAATSFFGGAFFGGEFFNTPATTEEAPRPPRPDDGGGGRRRRRGDGIVKPLGLPPKRKGAPAAVERRVDETHDIAAEVAGQLARELGEQREAEAAQREVYELTAQEVEREIGFLLRKKIRTEEDDLLLLLLMAAAAT